MEPASGPSPHPEVEAPATYPLSKKKPHRPFCFEQHPRRKIALRVAYHGQGHDGLAIQKETANTIEGLLCDALRRLRFIAPEGVVPEELSRCGRTDKGVSALSNCLSFIARASCSSEDEPQLPPIDYATKLNHVLPSTIRVVGYAHVYSEFDARFSCKARTYRYYFFSKGLDLGAMKEAVKLLEGTHNFRNFCILDVINVSNFERTIDYARIVPSESIPEHISYLEIKANSFLYHQVRCTMAVLFLVGRRLEAPSIFTELLNRGDCKPRYALADAGPLVLWECHFDDRLEWQITEKGLEEVERQLQDIATALLIRSASASAMRAQLFQWYAKKNDLDVVPSVTTDDVVTAGESNTTVTPHRLSSGEPSAPVDEWSPTGCDWTQSRTDELRRARQSGLLHVMRAKKTGTTTVASSEATNGSLPTTLAEVLKRERSQVHGYVPLLEREVERTFQQQADQLTGAKRARYEANMSLKMAGKQNSGKKDN